jgi:uncharacterized glyoxalase superfamily protein PhnB
MRRRIALRSRIRPVSPRTGIRRFSSREDVDAAYVALQERGVKTKAPVVTGYGMKQLYFKDPDGYEICLQHPAQ